MTWSASGPVGPDDRGIPEANMDEPAEGWAGMLELPHRKAPLATYGGPKRQGGAGGVWTYYAGLVSADL